MLKALAQYCHDEGIDVKKRGKPEVKLRDLLPIMRGYHDGWDHIKAEDLNTNRYRGVKLLNNELHKLLSDKHKLRKMVDELDSDSEGSDDDGSSSNRSLKGDEAVADLMGMRDKSKEDKKSKAGSNPPTKAKGKIDTPKEETKDEEAPASSSSN